MKLLKQSVPYVALLIVLLLLGSKLARNASVGGAREFFDYGALSRTVVMDEGRAKPLDSVARNALLVLYNKQQFTHDGERIDAIVWLMDVIARPTVARQYKVFRIDHADVIQLMGLRPEDGDDDKHFSYAQLEAGRPALMEAARAIGSDGPRTAYDKELIDLVVKLRLYAELSGASRPLVIPPEPGVEGSVWGDFGRMPAIIGFVNKDSILADTALMYTVIRIARSEALTIDEIVPKIVEIVQQGAISPDHVRAAQLYADYKRGGEAWDRTIAAMASDPAQVEQVNTQMTGLISRLDAEPGPWPYFEMYGIQPGETSTKAWYEIVSAYRNQEPTAFNEALAAREQALRDAGISTVKKAGFEVWFNRAMPFIEAIKLHVFGFLLAMVTLYFGRSERGSWGRAVWLGMMTVLGSALVVQTLGMAARMYIHARPPVTDLYSTAVLVGWAGIAVCLLVEWITKRGIGGVVAAIIGFATLVIAHNLHLQKGGDTIGPMRAVLDSNFWLATHVIVVTLGYAATFVAGLLAILYIVLGMGTPILDRPAARQLNAMVYGTVCFALLLSFVGTVLGGIWADQSWGRFWGWDPKENGAVMIVIMNALILHAKWGKLVKERGFMVLAVSGNIITAWSWFGTNELGVGLHAYGFTEGTLFWLRNFVVSQLLIMGAALLVPTRYWWSFRKPSDKPKPESGKGGPSAKGVTAAG